jgi:alpha-2-macroglobulin
LYFISHRRKGVWNTYQSSTILQTILPDLLDQGARAEQIASVNVSGAVTATVNKFPYKTQLQVNDAIHIRKDSGVPLYLMEYVNERVTKAKRGGGGFQITTSLDRGRSSLEAGKPITLTVNVEVSKNADAEYVMIEIPIPASCSYANKNHAENGIETHREYFKDHVAVFCEQMSPGSYTFDISLLPRFTGKYSVNPAQVSLMYIPVINANTDMKMVRVK